MGYKALRKGRWKYIHYLEIEGMDELYDLKTDPYEMKNLINQPGAEKALGEMKQEMERLLKETNAGSQAKIIPDDNNSRMISRLFERRKTAGRMAEDYPPSGGIAQ
jgi:arylsulfatase A-like enzyme